MALVRIGVGPTELDATLLAVAAMEGNVVDRRQVGALNWVLEVDIPGPAGDPARELRRLGHCAIDGPAGPGYEVVWDRRNAPSWFGDQACVCFPWNPVDRAMTDLVIEIDPGAGFGAGAHPTTKLLLQALLRRDLRATRVLDVGCGSGVLGIGAALMGAAQVASIDIDPRAVAATNVNAKRNGVAGRLAASDSSLEELAGPFDVIVANIHAHVLAPMATHFARLVTPTGWLGVSGISRPQVSTLTAALDGFRLRDQAEHDDWFCLELRPR